MDDYLLDTNHLSEAVDEVSGLREKFLRAMKSGCSIGVCVPVLCELEPRLIRARHAAENRLILDHLMERFLVYPLDMEVAKEYGILYWDLRARGRQLSQVDMMLAALCRRYGLVLLTSDRDFEALPDLRVENWLA